MVNNMIKKTIAALIAITIFLKPDILADPLILIVSLIFLSLYCYKYEVDLKFKKEKERIQRRAQWRRDVYKSDDDFDHLDLSRVHVSRKFNN